MMLARASTATAVDSKNKAVVAGTRLLALDGLRGLTVFLMLLVNNVALQEATPDQLMHAPFGGVTLADLVFPWFLFCMGAAIPYAASSFDKQRLPLWRRLLRILRRTSLIFLLGLFLTSALARTPVFALGVLQLIALAYCLAALFYLISPRPAFLFAVAAALLVGYWAAIRFVPIPGAGPGIFEEDRNLLLHLNKTYLEPLGLRGLLSTIPTAALALLGAIVAQVLRGTREEKREIGVITENPSPRRFSPTHHPLPQLLLLGSAMTGLGYGWSLELPFSKTFWTPPYILFSAGLATLLIGAFYVLFDLGRWKWLAFPFLVFGSNALLAYILPILFKVWVLQGWTVSLNGARVSVQQAWLNWHVAHSGAVVGGWTYTLLYILAWWLVFWGFYARKIYFRV
ncbi:MAG: hypothetical protein KatS3mg071_2052 [Meiothermus sp.]|nr:MAG: hypothetical protein KatS3mg071_2052 [Meiothermus sp.]